MELYIVFLKDLIRDRAKFIEFTCSVKAGRVSIQKHANILPNLINTRVIAQE